VILRFSVIRRPAITALSGALMLLAAAGAGMAADPPTPAALASARAIITSSGVTRSFDQIVPQMLEQLENTLVATRPEIKDSLRATLVGLEPEFRKTEQDVIDASALALANRMSEQELKETAAFFESASGKKYVDVQPAAFGEMVAAVQGWRQRLSTDMLARARVEMKKKGVDL
jgi:hypothetical protein